MNSYKDIKNEMKANVVEIIEKYIPESKEVINFIKDNEIDLLVEDFSKIYKIVRNLKDRIEVKKIEKMLKKLKNKEYVELKVVNKKEFYEKLFIVITRIDFEEKIDYLTELYILLAKQEISEVEFFRCSKILENISYSDLKNFENKEYTLENEDRELFYMSGLLERKPPEKDQKATIQSLFLYKNSRAGNILLDIKNIVLG